jgi:hypothetical protein
MSQRTYLRSLEVTCPNPDCTQPGDEFLVRYEVEEKEGVKTLIGRKAIEDAETTPQMLKSERVTGKLQHPCPWCGVTSIFSVPL